MDLVSPAGTLKLSEKTVHHSVVLSSVPRMSAELLTVETVDSATLTATVAVASSAVMVTVCVPALEGMPAYDPSSPRLQPKYNSNIVYV